MDIQQVIHQLMQIPGASQWIEEVLQNAFGVPGFGLKYTTYDPTKTLEYNAEQALRSNTIRNQLYGKFQDVSKGATRTAITNVYRTLGYDQQMAEDAAKAGEGGLINELVDTFIVQPQMASAYSNIGNALYNRSDQWRPNAVYRAPGSDAQNYWEMGRKVMTDVINSSVNQEYGGMGVKDTSRLAAEMIGAGALDGTTPENQDARINKFKRDLRSYATSVHALQDVIEGPVEDILDAFENLTGNKLVSMSAGRVEALSNQIRNVLSHGNISMQELSGMVAQQYGMIAPLGGSMQQATAMAVANSAAINSGYQIEGLSDQQLNEGLMVDNTRRMMSGELRSIAAAYQHWLGTGPNRKENNAANKERFFRYMQRGEYSGMNLGDAAAKYVRQNNLSGAYMTSGLVTATMADADFLTTARMEYVDRFEKSIDSALTGLSKEKAATAKKVISSSRDLTKIQNELMHKGFSATEAAQVYHNLAENAMVITGATDERVAMGLIATNYGAVNQTRMSNASDYLRKIRGIKPQSGAQGLISALLTDDKDNGYGLTRFFSAFMGMDYGTAEKYADAVDRAAENAKKGKKGKDAEEAANKAVRKEIVKQLQDVGLTEQDAEMMLDQTMRLETTGERILNLQGKAGKNAKEVTKAKSDLIDYVHARHIGIGKKAGFEVSMDKLKELTEDLDISQQDLDALYLAGQGMTGVTDEKVEKFRKTRDALDAEFKSKDIKSDALDKIAYARTAQKEMGQLAFTKGMTKGSFAQAKADLAKDTNFRAQVDRERAQSGQGRAADEDYEKAASAAMQQDGMMGLVQSILRILESIAVKFGLIEAPK